MKKMICVVFLLLTLCFILSGCFKERGLKLNEEMQDMLEKQKNFGMGVLNAPDNTNVCVDEHSPMWTYKESGHCQVCSRCGTVLSEVENHSLLTETADGFLVINNESFIILVKRCICGIAYEETHILSSNCSVAE